MPKIPAYILLLRGHPCIWEILWETPNIQTRSQSNTQTNYEGSGNHCMTAAVQMEMVIKIAGLGWKEYWGSGWNKLDFSLVVLSVVDVAFSYLESSVLRIIKVLKAQKLLRLLRMTRMAKALKTMRSMLQLLVAIKESMGAILQVLLYLLWIRTGYTLSSSLLLADLRMQTVTHTRRLHFISLVLASLNMCRCFKQNHIPIAFSMSLKST